MTEQKRRFKFNILDVLIIVIIIAVAVSAAIRYNLTEKIGLQASTDVFELKFRVSNIQEKSEQYFVGGGQWYIASNSKEFGVLKELLDIEVAKSYITVIDGKIVRTDLPDNRIDLTGVFTCKGTIGQQGHMVGGSTPVAPGKNIVLRNDRIADLQIEVIEVRDVKD